MPTPSLSKIKLNGTTYELKDTTARTTASTIAPIEESTTATIAHPLGSIFYLNNVLYRALSDIAIGDTINTASGGNATQTTIAQNFKRIVTLTTSQYNALTAAEKAADIVYIITDDDTIPATDVSYDNSESSLIATTIQQAVDTLADAINNKQAKIVASGLLKGDGQGGISAATAGTDYQAPLTFDTEPTETSTNPVTSDGIRTAIRARYSTNTIFNTITDVHTDTSITLDHSYTNYKFLMIIFNTTSTGSGGKRMPLVLATNALPQGGFYPLANPDESGYVRLNYTSGNAKLLRVQATNFTSLYITSVIGLT